MREALRGEKHHWWPKSLSKYWVNERGLVNRIDSNGNNVTSKPKEFGQISNGHNIIFNENKNGLFTVEQLFDSADGNMPKVIDWLEMLSHTNTNDKSELAKLIRNTDIDEHLNFLKECIVSLVVRSPKYRSSKNKFTESFRGKLGKQESMGLIAANINQSYHSLVSSAQGCGKVAVIVSEENEFIFGDGFYSNIGATTQSLHGLKLAIPLTPAMTVVWSSPMAFRTDPKIFFVNADKNLVKIINDSVQVYSKDYLFYRKQKPDLIPEFEISEHRVYVRDNDPVAKIIDNLIPDESKKYTRFHI